MVGSPWEYDITINTGLAVRMEIVMLCRGIHVRGAPRQVVSSVRGQPRHSLPTLSFARHFRLTALASSRRQFTLNRSTHILTSLQTCPLLKGPTILHPTPWRHRNFQFCWMKRLTLRQRMTSWHRHRYSVSPPNLRPFPWMISVSAIH